MNKVKKWIPPVIPERNSISAWKGVCNDIHENLIDAGLVQTSDTGQLDIDLVDTLPADNSYAGFRVYRFDDALQTASPIFIKLEFGCGNQGLSSSTAGSSGRSSRHILVRFSAGTGSDGAGSLINASRHFSSPQAWYGGTGAGGNSMNNNTYGISYYSRNDDLGFFGFFHGVGSRNRPFSSSGSSNQGSYYGASLAFMIQRNIDENGLPTTGGFSIWGPGLTAADSTNNLWDSGVINQPGYLQFVGPSGPGVQSRTAAPRLLGDVVLNNPDLVHLNPVFMIDEAGTIKQWPSVVTYDINAIVDGAEFDAEAVTLSPRNFCAIGNEHSIIVDYNGQQGGIAIVFESDE